MNVKRLLLALLIGLTYGLLCLFCRTSPQYVIGPGDLNQALVPAWNLVVGKQPLSNPIIGLYVPSPLTIIPLGLPFLLLPGPVAAAVFIAISYTWLAWLLIQHEPRWRLLIFLSPSIFMAAQFAQYPPLLLALSLANLAPIGLLIKPHIALPLVLLSHAKRAAWIVAFAILGLSLLIYPTWPIIWLSQLHNYQGVIPVLLPFGFGLLLILLRWPDSRARLLLLYILIPQRAVYDQVPVLLAPPGLRPMLVTLIVQWLLFFAPIDVPTRILLSYYAVLLSFVYTRRLFAASPQSHNVKSRCPMKAGSQSWQR